MYKKIMVPLDGSGASEIALPYAEEIAVKMAADMVVVSVSEPSVAGADHLYDAYLKSIEEKVLGRMERREAAQRPKVNSQVLLGAPSTEILRYADEKDVSLIVMAGRGRSGSGPWVLGNIATKVLRAAVKPVLLVKAALDSKAAVQENLIKKILLPLDGSQTGGQAITEAEILIRAFGAQTVLMQVLHPLGDIRGEGYRGYPVFPETELNALIERRMQFAEAYLEGVAKTLKEKGLVTLKVVLRGEPADQILEYAEAEAIDLIAMSTHGRSGIGRWLLGSVTEKVLHGGDTAVLVVRATGT